MRISRKKVIRGKKDVGASSLSSITSSGLPFSAFSALPPPTSSKGGELVRKVRFAFRKYGYFKDRVEIVL